MGRKNSVSRREFLRLAGLHLAALAFPVKFINPSETEFQTETQFLIDLSGPSQTEELASVWPSLQMERLPRPVQDVLARLPCTELDEDGLLVLHDEKGNSLGEIPLARTQWNLERNQPLDRLLTDWPWGLVLHWYGEPEKFDKTITGYLRGFDGLRQVSDYITRTSAHFLVGAAPAVNQAEMQPDQIGIVQTQAPDSDGVPYVASHLRPLDYTLARERKQYYVRALDALEYENPAIHSLLQDFYTGPKIDPGWRTIAIEITGQNFDSPASAPSSQQIANVLAVVWSVMKRYQIAALDVIGHNEIELGKSDPGKGFMALIRFLIGVKALVDGDATMKELVFGRLLMDGRSYLEAVKAYFQLVREYLVLVSKPSEVYHWEVWSQFWPVCDQMIGGHWQEKLAESFCWPLPGDASWSGDNFLSPQNHEGVDLFADRSGRSSQDTPVRLVAQGECLYAGKSLGHCGGKIAVFRHWQPDGALILTVYNHLSELSPLVAGSWYPKGHRLGLIASPLPFLERYLHFAVAYGATWETDLRSHPSLSPDARPGWIMEHYLPPLPYLRGRLGPDEKLPRFLAH